MKLRASRLLSIGFCCWLVTPLALTGFRLNRVILSTDNKPEYIQFWPIIARAWQELVGLRPTLVLVANDQVQVDTTLGDVIRFTPVPGVPTGLQAQVLRLLLPALFPDDGCIISDIDMLPLQKNFFLQTVAPYSAQQLVIYRAQAYPEYKYHRYPMCYVAAQGAVFGEIFGVTPQNFSVVARKLMTLWYDRYWKLYYGSMDERLLYRYLKRWHRRSGGRVLLDVPGLRVDRRHWTYDAGAVGQLQYVDAHLPRPYQAHRAEIDRLLSAVGLAKILTN